MDYTRLAAAVERAMKGLRQDVADLAGERDLNATGGTLRETTPRVFGKAGAGIGGAIIGQLVAPENWRYWGNGRGPGAIPPVANLQTWIDAKGLDLSAWAVAKSIAQRGTRDYRQGGENIVELAADNWDLSEVDEAFVRDVGDGFFELVTQAVRPLQN